MRDGDTDKRHGAAVGGSGTREDARPEQHQYAGTAHGNAQPACKVIAHADHIQVPHRDKHERKPHRTRGNEPGNSWERKARKPAKPPRHVSLQAFRIGACHEQVHKRVHEVADHEPCHKEHRRILEPRGEDQYHLRHEYCPERCRPEHAECAEPETGKEGKRHPETRPAADAEHVGAAQRVTENGLQAEARNGERRTRKYGCERPREPQFPQDFRMEGFRPVGAKQRNGKVGKGNVDRTGHQGPSKKNQNANK